MKQDSWREAVARKAYGARKCPFCGGFKNTRKDVFCSPCMEHLPAFLRKGVRDRTRYIDSYFEAEKFLTENPRTPKMTPHRRERFLSFHQTYLSERDRLLSDEVAENQVHELAWQVAQKSNPLLPTEIPLYRKLVAIQSVNGGILFPMD